MEQTKHTTRTHHTIRTKHTIRPSTLMIINTGNGVCRKCVRDSSLTTLVIWTSFSVVNWITAFPFLMIVSSVVPSCESFRSVSFFWLVVSVFHIHEPRSINLLLDISPNRYSLYLRASQLGYRSLHSFTLNDLYSCVGSSSGWNLLCICTSNYFALTSSRNYLFNHLLGITSPPCEQNQ